MRTTSERVAEEGGLVLHAPAEAGTPMAQGQVDASESTPSEVATSQQLSDASTALGESAMPEGSAARDPREETRTAVDGGHGDTKPLDAGAHTADELARTDAGAEVEGGRATTHDDAGQCTAGADSCPIDDVDECEAATVAAGFEEGAQCPCDGQTLCDPDTGVEGRCDDGVWQLRSCELGCATDGSACLPNTVAIPGEVTCSIVTGSTCDGPCAFDYDPVAAVCSNDPILGLLECDGPGDCPEGQECCHDDYALCGFACVPSGDCRSNAYECHLDNDAHVACDPAAPTDCIGDEQCVRASFVDNRQIFYCK